MKILSIIIIRMRHSADRVHLVTNLPEACYPYVGNLHLDFQCAKGGGLGYVTAHFPDVTDIRFVDEGPETKRYGW
jgi:hypothetical protein